MSFKTTCALFFLIVLSRPVLALPVTWPTQGAQAASFVPDGFQMIGQPIKGDLNRDGKPDLVFWVRKKEFSAAKDCRPEENNFVLLILFANEKKKYTLSLATDKIATRCRYSVPSDSELGRSLSVASGDLTLEWMPLARENSVSLKLRFQKGDWFLIHKTYRIFKISDAAEGVAIDTDFLTGREITRRYVGGKQDTQEKDKKLTPIKVISITQPF